MEITILRSISIFAIVGFVSKTSCDVMHELHFEQRIVSQITLLSGTRTRRLLSFNTVEERQKLCLYAKIEADLPYLDHNDVPEWYEIEPDPQLDKFQYGLRCLTLPTVYVLQKSFSPDLLIVFVQSSVVDFIFDPTIFTTDFVAFSSEDYRNLCDMAQEYVQVYFISRKIVAAQKYEFSWKSGIKEIDTAVPCPTLPKLYLRLRESSGAKEVNLIVHRSFIDDYGFEVGKDKLVSASPESEEEIVLKSRLLTLRSKQRLNLCTIARKYYYPAFPVHFVEDESVTEAQKYTFQYPGEQKEQDVAILCPALPNVYLRVDDSSEQSKIKLNFLETLADRYTYSVEVINYVYLRSPVGGKRKYWEPKHIEKHLFTSLTKEEHWSLCVGAQKHILDDGQVTFAFATKQSVFTDHPLILGPKYMGSPQLENFAYLDHKLDADVLIQCSEWPTVYLSVGKLDGEKKMNILLLQYQLAK